MTKDDVVKILREEQPYLKKEFGIKRMAIFGSFAKNTASELSDVDIFIEFDGRLGLRFMELVEYLEKKLNREVDILTPGGMEGIRVKKVVEEIQRSLLDV